MKTQHIETVADAIEHYMQHMGDGAMQPRRDACTETANGFFILRNTNGLLAVVSRNGVILDRIAGKVLFAPHTTSKRLGVKKGGAA